jgi:hypothetical protein
MASPAVEALRSLTGGTLTELPQLLFCRAGIAVVQHTFPKKPTTINTTALQATPAKQASSLNDYLNNDKPGLMPLPRGHFGRAFVNSLKHETCKSRALATVQMDFLRDEWTSFLTVNE